MIYNELKNNVSGANMDSLIMWAVAEGKKEWRNTKLSVKRLHNSYFNHRVTLNPDKSIREQIWDFLWTCSRQ